MDTAQKTWVDLLGRDTEACTTSGHYIIRCEAPGRWVVLWAFETGREAKETLKAWKDEVTALGEGQS